MTTSANAQSASSLTLVYKSRGPGGIINLNWSTNNDFVGFYSFGEDAGVRYQISTGNLEMIHGWTWLWPLQPYLTYAQQNAFELAQYTDGIVGQAVLSPDSRYMVYIIAQEKPNVQGDRSLGLADLTTGRHIILSPYIDDIKVKWSANSQAAAIETNYNGDVQRLLYIDGFKQTVNNAAVTEITDFAIGAHHYYPNVPIYDISQNGKQLLLGGGSDSVYLYYVDNPANTRLISIPDHTIGAAFYPKDATKVSLLGMTGFFTYDVAMQAINQKPDLAHPMFANVEGANIQDVWSMAYTSPDDKYMAIVFESGSNDQNGHEWLYLQKLDN